MYEEPTGKFNVTFGGCNKMFSSRATQIKNRKFIELYEEPQ